MDRLTEEVVALVGDVLGLAGSRRAVLMDLAGTHIVPEWTSAKHVEIIVGIEDRWNFEVPEDQIVKLTTIPRIVAWIQLKKGRP